jgi:hypothetical protein
MVSEWLRFFRLLYLQPADTRRGNWGEIKQLLKNRIVAARVGQKRATHPNPPVLFQIASAFWLSQAVYAAAKLGIADLLADDPQSSNQLALATGAHKGSLRRLMRALSGAGVFERVDDDHFALAPIGEGLRSAISGSLRETVITLGEIHYQACGELLYSVQTGCPAFSQVFKTPLFGYLGANPDASESFNRGMSNLSAMLAYAVLLAYDFSNVSWIVDVGGGEGKLLEKILDFYPKLNGIVFDSARTIETVRRNSGTSTRCSYLKGNFFESVPQAADLYLLCGVIHDWDDDHALQILRNCRKAMAKNGKLLLVEMVVPSTNSMDFSKLLDLNMLVMNGGRERTEAEFRALLDEAGYKLTRTISTLAPQSILEAVRTD